MDIEIPYLLQRKGGAMEIYLIVWLGYILLYLCSIYRIRERKSLEQKVEILIIQEEKLWN